VAPKTSQPRNRRRDLPYSAQASSSLPSGPIQDASAVTTAPRRAVYNARATSRHSIASFNDLATTDNPPPPLTTEQQVQVLVNAIEAAIPDEAENHYYLKCFPHNFKYDDVGNDYTREDLLERFNPNNYKIIGIKGGNEASKRKMVATFRDAAAKGWDAAATLDEGPAMDDDGEPIMEVTIEGEALDEDAKKTQQLVEKEWKGKMKAESAKLNKAWDEFLGLFDLPLVKAAARAGYLSRKRTECERLGKKFFLCSHSDGPGAGCLHNQYSDTRGRSCISNYFGRNKKQTKQIPNFMKWCRKHYQKDGYKDEIWQKTKKRWILEQLDKNEEEMQKDGHADLTYKIQLRAKDDLRRREFKDQKGLKGEPAYNDKHPADLDTLQHIYDNFCDSGKSKDECKELVEWAYKDFEKKASAWKQGKDEKVISRDFKVTGPKFVEFEMLPEYKPFYSKKLLDAREATQKSPRKKPETPKKPMSSTSPPSAGPSGTKKTPKRSRMDRDGESDHEDESPSKGKKKK
jgi:hypothetical protein